jgi:hypothetical protein
MSTNLLLDALCYFLLAHLSIQLTVSFTEQKYNLAKSNLLFFGLCFFGVGSKKSLPSPRSQRFSSGCFIILHVAFRL